MGNLSQSPPPLGRLKMGKLCAECGINIVKNPKRQSRCNQCLYKKYGAKQRRRLATPQAKEKLKQWRRNREVSAVAKARERFHSRRYAALYPEKEKAKWLLNRAILAGQIVRPIVCPRCKSGDRARDGRSLIQAHHDDYSKPLEVRWLCIQCHADLHRALKAKPSIDPNLVYPGKVPDFVFPEE